MRIGIFGGTFDPIHLGHLAAARAAMGCARLDRVLIMPSAQPPHRDAATAPAGQRLAMCALAVEDEAGLEVSDLEIRRGGLSYTSDTLTELHRIHPADELYLILGWDAARLFSSWHEPEQVKRLASVVVVGRPGTAAPDEAKLKSAGLDGARTILCLEPTPDISGSALRQAIADGRPVAGLVPEKVARFIASHHLYADNR